MAEFSDAQISAAARQLFHEGQSHGWWGEAGAFDPEAYDKLDPIGREEFDDLVYRVLSAAADARGQS